MGITIKGVRQQYANWCFGFTGDAGVYSKEVQEVIREARNKKRMMVGYEDVFNTHLSTRKGRDFCKQLCLDYINLSFYDFVHKYAEEA